VQIIPKRIQKMAKFCQALHVMFLGANSACIIILYLGMTRDYPKRERGTPTVFEQGSKYLARIV